MRRQRSDGARGDRRRRGAPDTLQRLRRVFVRRVPEEGEIPAVVHLPFDGFDHHDVTLRPGERPVAERMAFALQRARERKDQRVGATLSNQCEELRRRLTSVLVPGRLMLIGGHGAWDLGTVMAHSPGTRPWRRRRAVSATRAASL